MKYQNSILSIALLGIATACISFTYPIEPTPLNKQAGKTFKLIYIDNSKPGLSASLIDYIHDETDSIDKQPFLLYLSNNDNPTYTKNTSQIKEQLLKMSEEYSAVPDCIYDKKNILKIIDADHLNNLASIKIYFVLTENYLREILKEKPAYLLRFLPSELALLTKTNTAKIEVNICYSQAPGSKNDTEFKNIIEKMNFYNSEKYENFIQYHIIQK